MLQVFEIHIKLRQTTTITQEAGRIQGGASTCVRRPEGAQGRRADPVTPGEHAVITNIDRERTPAKKLVRRVKNRIIIG